MGEKTVTFKNSYVSLRLALGKNTGVKLATNKPWWQNVKKSLLGKAKL